MRRVLIALIIACVVSCSLVYAQSSGSAGSPPYAPRVRLTIYLFSPWLGDEHVTITLRSDTDARLYVEQLFRQGYWKEELEMQPGVIWPPSSIVWIKTKNVL